MARRAGESRTAYRDAIVRIGDNSYKVSHHKLVKRPLPTTVKLPPIAAADPRVSEYVFGPASQNVSRALKPKLAKTLTHFPHIATSVDFDEQFPKGRIRDLTKSSRPELFTWDFTTHPQQHPKPTWRYLTRGTISFSPDKPLPSINDSIHQISLRAKQRKFGAEIAKFCSNLSEETLSRFKEWHERMIRLEDDNKVPPNSLAPTLKNNTNAISESDEEPLKWQKPKDDELSSTLRTADDELSDDADVIKDENDVTEDDIEVANDNLNLIKQKVNLVDTYDIVTDVVDDDFSLLR